jgi:16S rRNA processing protein RimM
VDTPIVVGRISGVFGTRGWIRVHSYTRPLDQLLDYSPWSIGTTHGWRRFRHTEARRHHGGLVVALEGIGDRTAAAELVHCDIAVSREQLGDPGTGAYYWVDLIGLAVSNADGVPLGTVHGLLETAAHDVLRVVDADGRERLIPFVREVFVLDVDLDAGRLTVDWNPDD